MRPSGARLGNKKIIKKNSMVSNCTRCQIVRFYTWCQIVRGVKLSWCQIVRCQIVLVSNCPVSNCPRCQIVRCQIVLVSNCPPTWAVSNCPRCQIVLVSNCPWTPWGYTPPQLAWRPPKIYEVVFSLSPSGHIVVL